MGSAIPILQETHVGVARNLDLQDAGARDVDSKDFNITTMKGKALGTKSSRPTSLKVGQMTLKLNCQVHHKIISLECSG